MPLSPRTPVTRGGRRLSTYDRTDAGVPLSTPGGAHCAHGAELGDHGVEGDPAELGGGDVVVAVEDVVAFVQFVDLDGREGLPAFHRGPHHLEALLSVRIHNRHDVGAQQMSPRETADDLVHRERVDAAATTRHSRARLRFAKSSSRLGWCAFTSIGLGTSSPPCSLLHGNPKLLS